LKRESAAPRVVGVEIIQDISRISSPTDGFLRRMRVRAKSLLSDGSRTDTYVMDYVDRDPELRDAVAILAYAPAAEGLPIGATRVLFRRQLRYPAYQVTGQPLTTEVVAGLIEAPEHPVDAALRELYEETGLRATRDRMRALGRPFFPTPGAFTERFFPFAVEIDRDELESAQAYAESPMEEGADVLTTSLSDAMVLIDQDPLAAERGIFIADAKTEILLHRLQAYLLEKRS
jgi:8-oxo-dGTP pyrophosphatase MutT (NUDIX family)